MACLDRVNTGLVGGFLVYIARWLYLACAKQHRSRRADAGKVRSCPCSMDSGGSFRDFLRGPAGPSRADGPRPARADARVFRRRGMCAAARARARPSSSAPSRSSSRPRMCCSGQAPRAPETASSRSCRAAGSSATRSRWAASGPGRKAPTAWPPSMTGPWRGLKIPRRRGAALRTWQRQRRPAVRLVSARTLAVSHALTVESCQVRGAREAGDGRELMLDCSAQSGDSGAAVLGADGRMVGLYVGFRSMAPGRRRPIPTGTTISRSRRLPACAPPSPICPARP